MLRGLANDKVQNIECDLTLYASLFVLLETEYFGQIGKYRKTNSTYGHDILWPPWHSVSVQSLCQNSKKAFAVSADKGDFTEPRQMIGEAMISLTNSSDKKGDVKWQRSQSSCLSTGRRNLVSHRVQ